MAVAEIAGRRMTAEIDGDFVVFLIGPRFNNKLHLLRSVMDLGGRRGMKHMLDYLVAHPEKGLLAYEMGFPTIVQYWRSFEHLEAFAKDKDDPHLEVWRNYWRRVGKSDRTGIWHETYLVQAGQLRGRLREHAAARAGQGGTARAAVGFVQRPGPDRAVGRRLTAGPRSESTPTATGTTVPATDEHAGSRAGRAPSCQAGADGQTRGGVWGTSLAVRVAALAAIRGLPELRDVDRVGRRPQ